MYFVYGERDPRCSCCPWDYAFDEFGDHEKAAAMRDAAQLQFDGYDVRIVIGVELQLDEGVLDRVIEKDLIKRQEKEAKEKEDQLARDKNEFERLKSKLGE